MKLKTTLIILIGLGITSCSKWHYGDHKDDDDPNDNEGIYNEIIVEEGAEGQQGKISLSPNEVVVTYDDVDTTRKTEIRDSITAEYPTLEILKCDCGSDDIEMWKFDPATPNVEAIIEGVVDRLPRRNPQGRIEGEQSFIVSLPEMPPYAAQGQSGGNRVS